MLPTDLRNDGNDLLYISRSIADRLDLTTDHINPKDPSFVKLSPRILQYRNKYIAERFYLS